MLRHDALIHNFGFSLEELTANRDGYITKQQRQELERQRELRYRLRPVIPVVAVVIALYAVVDGIRIHDTLASRIGIVGLISILAGIAFFIVHSQYRGLKADLYKGDVTSVEGILRKPEIRWRGTYILQIQKLRFNVSRELYGVFDVGIIYRIYYAPHSKMILSVESSEQENKDASSQ
jgi:hypothetical protein